MDRRNVTAVERLAAGMLRLYQRATSAKEGDPFVRDAQTWIDFEQAAMPEMNSFEFVDKATHRARTPSSVLADAMGVLWTADRPQLTTARFVRELAEMIGAQYEVVPLDRRRRSRASLGIDVVG